jgi:predicted  nucleic acid-binding Zn-ribbon protein
MNLANYSFEEGKKCSGTPLSTEIMTGLPQVNSFVNAFSHKKCGGGLTKIGQQKSNIPTTQACKDLCGPGCDFIQYNTQLKFCSLFSGDCTNIPTNDNDPQTHGYRVVKIPDPAEANEDCSTKCDANEDCKYFNVNGNECKTFNLDGCDITVDLASTLYRIKKRHRQKMKLENVNSIRQVLEAELSGIQDELNASITALEGSQTELAEVEAALSGEVTTLGTNTDDLKLKRDKLLSDIAAQKNAADGLAARFDEAKTEINATSDVLDDTLTKLEESNETVGATKEALEASKNSLNETKNSFDATKAKISSLQTSLENTNTEITQVTSSLGATDVSFFGDAMEIVNDFFSFLF